MDKYEQLKAFLYEKMDGVKAYNTSDEYFVGQETLLEAIFEKIDELDKGQ